MVSTALVGRHRRGCQPNSLNTGKLGGLAVDCGDRTKVAAVRGQASLARPEHVLCQVTHVGAQLQAFVCTLEEPCLCYSSSEEDLRRPVDHMPHRCGSLIGLPARLWGSQAASREGLPAEPGR